MLNKFRYIICLAAAPLLFGQPTVAQDTLTLEKCIQMAMENNLEVRQNQLRRQSQGIDLRQAKHNLLPDLNARLGHSFEVGRAIDPETNQYLNNVTNRYGNQSISSSVVLFDGLRMFHNITQQAHAYRAAQLEEQLVNERVALDVTSAYIQVLTTRDMVVQIENQLEVTREQVGRTTLLHEEGNISPGEYYDLRGQYASELNGLNDAKNRYNEALVSLFSLLNKPYDQTVALTSLQELPLASAQLSENPTQLYQTATEHLGIIKAVDHRARQAQFGLKAARSSYLPSLSASAGLGSSYIHGNGVYLDQVQDRVGQNLSFTLSIPILNRLQVRNNVARAKLNLLDAEYIAENTRNQLQQTAHQVLFNLDAAKENYTNLVEQVEHYTESFRVAEVRFNAGAINSVEFLMAKNKMDNANANLVIARYQWHLRQRVVDYYNGEMILGTAN